MFFELLPYKNIGTYNAMLSGFLHDRRLSEAMSLIEMMPKGNAVSRTAMICGLADAERTVWQEVCLRRCQ